MPDPAALRALSMIRRGPSTVLDLARMTARRRELPQDYYDPEAEAADSLDEYDYGATAMPGDPFPDRPFDPGDEGRAAAIDAYNRGTKPGADPSPYGASVAPMELQRRQPDAGWSPLSGHPGYEASPDGAIRRERAPRAANAAEALAGLGPIFAGLQGTSAYTGTPSVTTAPMAERYTAAGMAPALAGHMEPDADDFGGPPDNDADDYVATLRGAPRSPTQYGAAATPGELQRTYGAAMTENELRRLRGGR